MNTFRVSPGTPLGLTRSQVSAAGVIHDPTGTMKSHAPPSCGKSEAGKKGDLTIFSLRCSKAREINMPVQGVVRRLEYES